MLKERLPFEAVTQTTTKSETVTQRSWVGSASSGKLPACRISKSFQEEPIVCEVQRGGCPDTAKVLGLKRALKILLDHSQLRVAAGGAEYLADRVHNDARARTTDLTAGTLAQKRDRSWS